MKVEQIYTGCIAHAAYYIENNGEAAIFDPLRGRCPAIAAGRGGYARHARVPAAAPDTRYPPAGRVPRH